MMQWQQKLPELGAHVTTSEVGFTARGIKYDHPALVLNFTKEHWDSCPALS